MESNTNTPTTTAATTSTPSSSTVSRTILLLLRDDESEIKFKDFHAYRYMISTIVIGFAYKSLQMALSIFSAVSGNRVLNGDGGYKFDFYGDKIISYFLLSGSAAGFCATEDLHRIFKAEELPLKATAIASVFTSFALPKKAK
ncbi:CASP protein 4D1 [Trifolium repens]|nr:CASP protein 4D1 [Trifolium repens]